MSSSSDDEEEEDEHMGDMKPNQGGGAGGGGGGDLPQEYWQVHPNLDVRYFPKGFFLSGNFPRIFPKW